MNEEPWHVRRRRELEAAAPVKRKRTEPFVKVPMWWAEAAAKAARSPATLVIIELLYLAWKTRSATFPMANLRLRQRGVSREIKRRVLRDLEHGGVISIERLPRKAPVVTLIGL